MKRPRRWIYRLLRQFFRTRHIQIKGIWVVSARKRRVSQSRCLIKDRFLEKMVGKITFVEGQELVYVMDHYGKIYRLYFSYIFPVIKTN